MSLKTTNNSKLKTNQKNTIKSNNVVANNEKFNNTKSDFISDTKKESISYNSSSTNNSNLGTLKANNKTELKSNNIIKSLGEQKSVNANNSNLGSLRTNNNTSRISNNDIDRNIKFVKPNSSKIKINIDKLNDSSFSKYSQSFRNNIKSKINSDINKLVDRRVLDTTNLDSSYHGEIGSNTLKATYNTIIKTRRGIQGTVGTVRTIQSIPKKYNVVKREMKGIPYKVISGIDNFKISAKSINTSSKVIVDEIRKGNLKNALKEIPLKSLSKSSLKGVSKIFKNTSKMSKKVTIKGARQFGRGFRNSAIGSKSHETNDLGSDTIFATYDLARKTTTTTAKGIRATRKVYNRISTAKTRSLKVTKTGTLKTKILKSNVSSNVRAYFKTFKSSKVSRQAIKKYIDILKNKFNEITKYLFASVIKNPIVIGFIAIGLVMFILFSSLLNSIMGVHGSLFIPIDNQNEWISNINRLDKDIQDREERYNDVRTVRNFGVRADWRDVIIAYYMKNNNSTSLAGGSISLNDSLNGETVSVDQETWDSMYKELQSYLGIPYLWGGADPSGGFDCSGLVQYVYAKYGIQVPRITEDQVFSGSHIEKADLKAGDLVFFGTSDDVHHVGIYIGNGQYIHAPQTGDVVKVSALDGRTDYYEGRRVFEEKGDSSDSDSSNNSETKNTDKILYTALPNNKDLVDIFYKVQDETGVDGVLLASIAMTESSLNPNSISQAGASGLCQLMPDTFTGLGFDVSLIFDPYTNVLACAYEILDLYNYSAIKNPEDMLKAYNAGIGNFLKYNGDIPFAETQAYSGKVLGFYSQLSNGEQPSTMEGGSVKAGVNTRLADIYNCFVKLYKPNEDSDWILRIYTLSEALDNLGFTDEEKEQFYEYKEYNDNFDDSEQFGEYNIDFDFNI